MMRRSIFAATLLLAAPAAAQVGRPTTTDTTRRAADSVRAPMARPDTTGRFGALARRDSAPAARPDPARGADAEIRIALYDLMANRYLPALGRLQALQASPVTLADAPAAAGALRGRNDMLFLLAESYYRLGMDQSFRNAAQQLTSGSGAARYGSILRSQLLLDAYRHGDYARAIEMGRSLQQAEARGLAPLVVGLSQYQTRAYADARTSFAAAQQGGGPYASYAAYMDALAQLRSDTANAAPALAALQTVASAASGEFADQVRLTAAQLAYESEKYDVASTLAGQIQPTSGLGAQALLTRAWALYKSNQIEPAGAAFADFATRFPQLPERDESRLMSAQALLQLGRTDEAGRVFRTVSDSVGTEAKALQARASATMADAARALVRARAAGLLFIADPASGKTVALQDAAGSEASVLAAAVADSVIPGQTVAAPEVISLQDVTERVSQLGPAVTGAFPQRILFTQTSATSNRADYATRAGALYDADVAVALARFRLQSTLDAQARQIAMLQRLQQLLSGEASRFGTLAQQIQAAQDSLARLSLVLDQAAVRLRQMFQAQISATRLIANENSTMIDSVRSVLGASLTPQDAEILSLEAQTATTYRQVADVIEQGLDRAVGHHPAFAYRDSVRMRAERNRGLLTEAQNALATAQRAVTDEIARVQGSDVSGPFRSALASAETQRNAAEAQLVTVVERELNSRAGELLAGLRRDTEAADFGVASASFFQALDAGRTPGATGTNGTSGGSATTNDAGGATRSSSPASTLPRK